MAANEFPRVGKSGPLFVKNTARASGARGPTLRLSPDLRRPGSNSTTLTRSSCCGVRAGNPSWSPAKRVLAEQLECSPPCHGGGPPCGWCPGSNPINDAARESSRWRVERRRISSYRLTTFSGLLSRRKARRGTQLAKRQSSNHCDFWGSTPTGCNAVRGWPRTSSRVWESLAPCS